MVKKWGAMKCACEEEGESVSEHCLQGSGNTKKDNQRGGEPWNLQYSRKELTSL